MSQNTYKDSLILIEKLGILDNLISKISHFKILYIDPSLNEVWSLRERENIIAALNLCNNIRTSV